MAEHEVPPDDGTVKEHVHELDPGEECPVCHRKVPHPKKDNSPETKVVAYRVPLDEHEAHKEVYAAAAAYMGLENAKFEKFKVLTVALASVLQDPALKDYATRD